MEFLVIPHSRKVSLPSPEPGRPGHWAQPLNEWEEWPVVGYLCIEKKNPIKGRLFWVPAQNGRPEAICEYVGKRWIAMPIHAFCRGLVEKLRVRWEAQTNTPNFVIAAADD